MPKTLPNLHPAHLLRNLSDQAVSVTPVPAKLQHVLISDDAKAEMYVAKDGVGFQLHVHGEEHMKELYTVTQRALNVWDGAPPWLWQMDALLAVSLGAMPMPDFKTIRPEDQP